jgi:hypothetical protein
MTWSDEMKLEIARKYFLFSCFAGMPRATRLFWETLIVGSFVLAGPQLLHAQHARPDSPQRQEHSSLNDGLEFHPTQQAVELSASNLDKLKNEYKSVNSQLQKHVVDDWWIDDDPESPKLLARQWSLISEWVAAWLDANSSAGPEGVKMALAELLEQDGEQECLQLSEGTFLVNPHASIGDVFIVSKYNGHYHRAWSTSQVQRANGDQAKILAAWRPEHALHGGRGPYWAASGGAGSVSGHIGILPSDSSGHPRFYIDAMYAQSAGGTVGAQISVWSWDGVMARPLTARDYNVMIDQAVGTRVEGDLLKVQQKKFFRTFYSCGSCEERQTDWIVRLTPEGIQDLGEKSAVPELDAVDELFYRTIHHESAANLAVPSVLKIAEQIIGDARTEASAKDWKEFPTLGMIMGWKIQDNTTNKILCLSLLDVGTNLFTLKPAGGKFFIVDLKPTKESCNAH